MGRDAPRGKETFKPYNRPAPRADHSVRLPRCRSTRAICHHRCFFGFWVVVLSSGFRQNSRPARLSFSRQISQDYKTIRTRPRFDPTLDLPVRRLTEPRVKYLSVSSIQEAGHWRPHHGARTPPVTARRRVAPDTPSRLQSRLQSRAGPKQVRATPSQHTLTLIFGSTRGCGPCDPPLARRAGCTHHRPTHPPGHEVEGAESCDMTAAADRGAGARISRINPRASRNPRIRSPAATRGSRLARLAKS